LPQGLLLGFGMGACQLSIDLLDVVQQLASQLDE
jgi:hypothetical protein